MKTIIKNIADTWVGYQPKSRSVSQGSDTHRLIQIKDLRDDGSIDFDSLSWVAPDRDPGKFQVRNGDVLFSARGKYNAAYVLPDAPAHTLAGGNFLVIRSRQRGVLPEYLAWCLNQPVMQEEIRGRMVGSNMLYISKKAFEQLEILIPPLGTQSMICDLIGLQQLERKLLIQLAAKREQLVQAVCYRAAHQKVRKGERE